MPGDAMLRVARMRPPALSPGMSEVMTLNCVLLGSTLQSALTVRQLCDRAERRVGPGKSSRRPESKSRRDQKPADERQSEGACECQPGAGGGTRSVVRAAQ